MWYVTAYGDIPIFSQPPLLSPLRAPLLGFNTLAFKCLFQEDEKLKMTCLADLQASR